MKANYVQRIRIVFSKGGPTRYIGHLDLAKTMERSFNRAGIPLAYTQGYNRRPRLQLPAALPLGFSSECEVADLWLTEVMNPQQFLDQTAATMAPGIRIFHAQEVDLRAPTPQTQRAIYQISFLDQQDADDLQTRIIRVLEARTLERERRGKVYDLRPLILNLDLTEKEGSGLGLQMELSLLPGKTGRPDEVLDELGLDPLSCKIHRTKLVLAKGD